MMKIGIIGAGFCGLTAAYKLSQKGHKVCIFEKEKYPGGLASSFEVVNGILVEHFVHHIFQTDKDIISLISEVELADNLVFVKSRDANFYQGKSWSFSSPVDLLKFSPLSFFNRLRLGLIIVWLKQILNWRNLEKLTAIDWIKRWMGRQSYEVIWQPLLLGKFGNFANHISMAWFWARIWARTAKLGYLNNGGFALLAKKLVEKVKQSGGQVLFSKTIVSIKKKNDKVV